MNVQIRCVFSPIFVSEVRKKSEACKAEDLLDLQM